MRYAKIAVAIVLSVGWILPQYLGCDTVLTFVNSELYPRILGHSPLNSFPFIQFSKQMFTLSLAWLSVALVFWSGVCANIICR